MFTIRDYNFDEGLNLYHGIRFDAIDRLESIFQKGYILPANKIEDTFLSYDGKEKSLYINYGDKENCNMGKYISVMPCTEDQEFDVFVRENLFLILKGTIDVVETIHVSYDEYMDLAKEEKERDYYSYAFDELFAIHDIPIEDIKYIGIDKMYFKGDYNKTVDEVINLINEYNISIPFVDKYTDELIYKLDTKKLTKKTK